LVRFRDENGKQHHGAIGAADDALDPDGLTIFSMLGSNSNARRITNSDAHLSLGVLDCLR